MALTEAKPAQDFDFMGANQERLMCYVDIPNECAIERKETQGEEDKEGDKQQELEQNVSEGVQAILVPPAPFCPGHAIFPMNFEQALTQELSDDILTILLQVFAATKNLTLK